MDRKSTLVGAARHAASEAADYDSQNSEQFNLLVYPTLLWKTPSSVQRTVVSVMMTH